MATIDYGFGVSAIDADYLRPRLAAIHLLVESGRAAIIDAGTQFSLPAVLHALAEKGIPPENVDYLMLTHIHLDHAGGAGAFMRVFPNARLTVHPRGVFHLVDPSKLVAAVSAVYGEAETHRMYGDIVPVPRGRIVPTPDGTCLQLAGRTLRFYDTPGHARHHVAIHDEKTRWMFAGDTFGLSYRELDVGDRQFVFPTTSPAHFDPAAYHRSIDLVARLAADSVFVTHFSRVREPLAKAEVLHRLIDGHVDVALAARDAGEDRARALFEGVRRLFLDEARRYGSPMTEDELLEIYGMDIDLNAQGLGAWLDSEARLQSVSGAERALGPAPTDVQ